MGVDLGRVDATTAQITFHDPSNGNCVRARDLIELAAHLDALAGDVECRTLIVTGANGDFCSGRIGEAGLVTGVEIADDLGRIVAVNERLGRFKGLVIAAVEGRALGFGCGFATQCDVTIAGEGARFALPELSHGLPPLIVLSYLVKYVPYKQAFDLALSGRAIGAGEAVRIGIATRAVPAGSALSSALEIARHVQDLNPRAVQELRQFARRAASLNDDAFAQYGLYDIAAILSERSA